MPADRMLSLTSIWGTAHTFTNHPACATPGWQFIAGSGLKPRLGSLEASVRTSRLSCQPFVAVSVPLTADLKRSITHPIPVTRVLIQVNHPNSLSLQTSSNKHTDIVLWSTFQSESTQLRASPSTMTYLGSSTRSLSWLLKSEQHNGHPAPSKLLLSCCRNPHGFKAFL